MHILGIKVSGYRMLKDNFTIDFRTKAKVDPEFEYEDEVMNLLPKIDCPRTTIFTGPNASGKTSILQLISMCLEILIMGELRYSKYNFKKDFIELEFVFEINGELMKYHGIINKPATVTPNIDVSRLCSYESEELLKRTTELKLKKDDIFDSFDLLVKNRDSFSNGGILPHLSICGSLYPNDAYKKTAFYAGTSHNNIGENMFYINKFFDIPKTMQKNILRVLDDSIELFELISREKGIYMLKRYGADPQNLNFIDVYNLLSAGTTRGMIIFSNAFYMLEYGGLLVIDEVENSFHSSLVGDLIFLFNDEKINKNNATLIVSTHYSDVLNMLRRRDSIYVCHKNKGIIDVKNMYDYRIRSELSKSNLYDNNYFNNLANYDAVMDLREVFNNEISSGRRAK